MLARLLAVVAAVAMVAGALAVRERREAGDGAGGGGGGPLRLVCSTELAGACERLARATRGRVEPTVEPARTTADRLARAEGSDAGLDGWLVAGPWPAMVADARRRAGRDPLLRTSEVLARSPLAVAVWKDRAAALLARCGGSEPSWRCLGDVAGKPWADVGGKEAWGRVEPGYPDRTTAVGLAVLGAATAGYVGGTDIARIDLEEDDGYRGWLADLERSVPSRPAELVDRMLVAGPAAFDWVATVEAEAAPAVARSARRDKPILLYPSPVVTADVVLGTVPGRRPAALAGIVGGSAGRHALAGSDWRVPGTPAGAARGALPLPPAAPRTLPPESGLPPPGVLDAIAELAAEVAR